MQWKRKNILSRICILCNIFLAPVILVLEWFLVGQTWHLPCFLPVVCTTGEVRLFVFVCMSLTKAVEAADALRRHPLFSIWGFTRTLSSCSGKILLWLTFSLFQSLFISHHITNALYALTSLMRKKMTSGQQAVIHQQLYVAVTLSRLSTSPFVSLWSSTICVFVFPGAQSSIFVHHAEQHNIFPFLGAIGD